MINNDKVFNCVVLATHVGLIILTLTLLLVGGSK